MSNQINEVKNIEPYLHSFSFFSSNDSLKKNMMKYTIKIRIK